MALIPMALYGLEVPPGDVAITARPDIPSAFRITMAAIDPSAEAEGDEGAVPRATLKVIRQSLLDEDDDDADSDSSFDQEQMEALLAEEYSDDDESSEDDEVNGGPSDPAKSKKARKEAAKLDIQKMLADQDGMEMDDDESDDDAMPNGVNGVTKSAKALGKMPASDEDDDEDSEIDEDFMEEYVICTLDPSKLYQQPLDITFGEDERVWFKVSGTHSIFLTGNYVEPPNQPQGMFDPDSDEEEDYDLEPDADELDVSEDESMEDELDDLEEPRVTELEDDEQVPKLVSSKNKNKAAANKNKRPAQDSDDEDVEGGAGDLDTMIAKESKATQPAVNGEVKLSKNQMKKLKKNNGAAGTPPAIEKVAEKKEVEVPTSSASNKSDKKVSFAKELEQGPTPTPTKDSKDAKSADKNKPAPSLGVKTVQGVTLDDKKLGSGQAAKNGDRVSLRYIGKLKDTNAMFDSNKKGKPFSFKLGANEVIKGWEIGVQGMQAGGERRITIPAHLGYGSQKMPGIPANSALVFDVKVLEVAKK